MEWIHIDPPIRPYTEVEKRIIELLDQGVPWWRIASRLHISYEECKETICNIHEKESIRMGRIPNDEWADAYASYKSGAMTQSEIAKKLGISVQAVCKRFKKLSAIEAEIFDKPAGNEAAEEDAPITETDEPAPKDKLPEAVYRALLDKLNDCAFEIEQREQRIAELQAEIAEYEQIRKDIIEWKEPYEK